MKEIIKRLDLIIDALRKGEKDLALVGCVVLRAQLLARKENVKLARKVGARKRELINVIKKL